ncbi:hypothetical protein QGP82_06475 [Leptothoe sp. LEGE 181152]|nr:hypothetical protein [Leptothoe sp. LEGE 181152]
MQVNTIWITDLALAQVFPIPTSIPIASSIKAQLQPELWQRNEENLAVCQHQSKSNPANFIEHYITNPRIGSPIGQRARITRKFYLNKTALSVSTHLLAGLS